METVELSQQQSLRITKSPEDHQMIGVDGKTPFVRKPTGHTMRIQQNGRLTSATIAAKRRLAERGADRAGRGADVTGSQTPKRTQIGTRAGKTVRSQPESVDLILRLQRLERSTQAALGTLRRCLIEKVPPTRNELAHEAAIAFDLRDDRQALAIIDDIAQTVGISALS
jgi:hypothetical protein